MLSSFSTPHGRGAATAAAVFMTTALLTPPANAVAELITVPGSNVKLKLFQQADAVGEVVAHYAISLDGREFSEPRATSYEIMLRYAEFDPLDPAPLPLVDERLQAAEDTNLYIVQYVTQPLPEFRAAIEDLGGAVRWYVPRHAEIVEMDPATYDAVARLPFVRWLGVYHPAYRLEEFMLDNLDVAETMFPLQRYNIMVMEPEQKAAVAQRIAMLGGIVDRSDAGKYLVEATLRPDELLTAARWDEVLFIDRWTPGGPDMDIAREIGGADLLESAIGLTGSGVRGESIDTGFNLDHVDFASRPLIQHTSVTDATHGASTIGICFGDGTGDATARGLLPTGQGIVASWFEVSVGQPRYDHTGELVQDPYFAVFQTASVGSDRTTQYSTISADTDAQLFDFDIVHCQSQSNAGNQDSRPQAWAKNIISGGAVYHQNTLTKSDDAWNGGASTGPATDGRVKPDLCSFYDNIRTTSCCGSTSYTSSFGGTSGATPIICGHVGLFFEMWAQGVFNNPVDPTGTVFENRSHMTTAKAMLINSAEQYDWTLGGPNGDINRFRQGWGMPDLDRLYQVREKLLIVDETDLLTNLQTNLYVAEVLPGEEMLKATLVYADPPGNPSVQSQHRVNDLSLRVTSPTGDVYWGNNGLTEGLWSTPGGAANDKDTVENVFVQNPAPGSWMVEVIAHELIEDGHVETSGTLDADYALIVSGVLPTLPPLFVLLPEGLPDLVLPGEPTEIAVEISSAKEEVVPGSEMLHYRFDPADPFTSVPLELQSEDLYLATVPAADCDDEPQFYFSAEGSEGTVVTNPPNAPDSTYGFDIGEFVVVFSDDFESDTGWTVTNIDLDTGPWERGIPEGGGDRGDPATDADGSGQCFTTGLADGNNDVDGGPTILTSPALDATLVPDPTLRYSRWFYNDDQDQDNLLVEISDDDGVTWTVLEDVGDDPGWKVKSWQIADYVEPTSTVRVRFTTVDNPNDSVTEAGVDAVEICAFVCGETSIPGDVDGDGDVDFTDLVSLLSAWGSCPSPPAECPADFDGSGVVDFTDLLTLLSAWS